MSTIIERESLESKIKTKRFLLNCLLSIKEMLLNWLNKKEKIIILREMLNKVSSYKEWKQIALELDCLENREIWKKKKESSLYDHKEVERLIKILKIKRETKDIIGLTHYLRANLVKNLFSTNNPLLYHFSNHGTKHLINEFQDEMLKSFDFIFEFDEKRLPFSKKLQFFSESKHSYGRTALLLSGGATLGFYHIGVLKALFENQLLPRIICGSSAGSFIAAILCVTPFENLKEKFKEQRTVNIFVPKLNSFTRYFSRESLYDLQHLKEVVRENIGDLTFQEAYDKTGWILNITVTGYKEHDNHRVLNYVSSPNVLIWTATCASCAVPGIFDPVELLCKNEYGHIVPYHLNKDCKYIDGTISCDLPMKRISELFNVNTFIVSQTNPFVIPFLDNEDGGGLFEVRKLTFGRILKYLIGSEIKHRCNQLANLGLVPNVIKRFLNIVTQEYRGDVTILPVPSIWQVTKTISNPTIEEVDKFRLESERITFPKISMIENIYKIELALDNNYSKLKKILKTKKFITNKTYDLDEENYDYEICIKQTELKIPDNLPIPNREYDAESVSENENLDEICEKHDKIIFYNRSDVTYLNNNIALSNRVIEEIKD